MLMFGKLTYKNILSVGNTPIEIDLSQFKKILITGKNGAGKSTMIEALSMVLFGKSFRNINKGALVNTTNKKSLLVTQEIYIKGDEYTIKRGIKPTIFEITRNGKVVEATGSSNDFQEWFEEHVIKMNFETFKQIVVLGTAGFEPFMDLSTPKRRAIVENLIDTNIFSIMNQLNKDEIKELKHDSIRESDLLENQKKILIVQESNNTQAKENYQEQIDRFVEKSQKYKSEGKLLSVEYKVEKIGLDSIDDCHKIEMSNFDDELSNHQIEMKAKLSEIDDVSNVNDDDILNKKRELSTTVDELKVKRSELLSDLQLENVESISAIEISNSELLTNLADEHNSAMRLLVDNAYILPNLDENSLIISNCKTIIGTNKKLIETNSKRLEFFEHTVQCPTCETELDDEYKSKMVGLLDGDTVKLKTIIDDCLIKIQDNTDFIVNAKEQKSKSDSEIDELDKSNKLIVIHTTKMLNSVVESLRISNQEAIDKLKDENSELISVLESNNRDELDLFKTNLDESVGVLYAKHSEISLNIERDITSKKSDTKDKFIESSKPLREKVSNLAQSAKQQLTFAKDIEGEIETLEIKKSELSDDNDNDLQLTKDNIRDILIKIRCIKTDLSHRDVLSTLLKDSGIKAKIVKQYIPFINSQINYYLKIMGAKFNFTLDEEFNETIKSRGRETFTYNSFSQGEKMRIDVAIMFTWRDVVRKRTNFVSNLLVMDEVMDGASDDAGIKSLHSLIDDLDDNVIIISHNETHDLDSFDEHLRMVKKGNFTSIGK